MAPDPEIPSTKDADPDVQSTPGGLTQELEEEIEEHGAEVGTDGEGDS
jgi:hypothetical protein